jgi:hypothetical protein
VEDNIAPTAVCQDITVSLDATGNVTITAADVDGGSSDNCAIDTMWLDIYDFDCTDLGDNTVTLTVEDHCGLQSTCIATVTVEDDLGPVVTCPADRGEYVDISDNFTIPDYTGEVIVSDNCSASPTLTQSPVLGTVISGVGTVQTITITADDGNGNNSQCTFDITLIDSLTLTITCPGDTNEYVDASCEFTLPDYTGLATTTGAVSVTQSPAIGTVISGHGTVQTITLTAQDGGGNSEQCTFDVTLLDTIAPTFTAPADITIYSDASCAYDASVGVTGDVTDEADNCGVGEATYSDVVDATDPTNIIISRTWSLTDNAGNPAADQIQTITVNDNTPPVITGCPANINELADTSYCGAEVTWIEPTVSDNCPGVILTSTHNPGDFFPVGTTTVTYTATDASGLTDLCTFDVIVAEASAPVISGSIGVCTPTQETYSIVDPGSHTFTWIVTEGAIPGSSNNSDVTIDWTGTTQGTLEVTITSGSGCTNSNSITVEKYATPINGNINSSNSLIRR